MRKTDTHFFFYRHYFGQWTMREMVCQQGFKYNCCEQYMMFQKAMIFGDYLQAEKIMNEKDPHKQQKLGRGVSNYDQETWNANRLSVVLNANMLKFTQHLDLQDMLVETEDLILVEASPIDKIWGVGLAEDNDKILSSSNWKGMNLLGKALMTVRCAIRMGNDEQYGKATIW